MGRAVSRVDEDGFEAEAEVSRWFPPPLPRGEGIESPQGSERLLLLLSFPRPPPAPRDALSSGIAMSP